MLDLETLGTKPGSIILSIGAVGFSPDNEPEDWPSFYSVISIDSSRKAGLTSDQATLAWWKRQSDEARETLTEADDPLAPNLETVLGDFARWVRQRDVIDNIRVWGNGSDFDNVLLISAYETVGLRFPWKYTGHRCYRTLKSLFPNEVLQETDRQGTAHNALDDAMFQALSAAKILRRIRGYLADSQPSSNIELAS